MRGNQAAAYACLYRPAKLRFHPSNSSSEEPKVVVKFEAGALKKVHFLQVMAVNPFTFDPIFYL